jgi:hypothetical protein
LGPISEREKDLVSSHQQKQQDRELQRAIELSLVGPQHQHQHQQSSSLYQESSSNQSTGADWREYEEEDDGGGAEESKEGALIDMLQAGAEKPAHLCYSNIPEAHACCYHSN